MKRALSLSKILNASGSGSGTRREMVKDFGVLEGMVKDDSLGRS
jgi:hypothetical protein